MKFYKSYGISFTVLLMSLFITWLAWQYTRHTIRLREEAVFLQEAQEIEDVIRYRLDDYREVLFGLRSLFATREDIASRRWNAYCESLDLRSRVPGIESLRFDARVTAPEKSAFIEKIRSDATLFPEGFPTFTIFPAPNLKEAPPPNQDEWYVVTYIWPWEKNKKLHGLDIFSVPERRLAIEQARDTGKPVVSSRTRSLVDQNDPLPGFVMYLPVYRDGALIATVEERRAAIQGVIAVRFRADELIEKTLLRKVRYAGIDVEIFDGNILTAEHLYYNDDDILRAQDTTYTPAYSKTISINVYGRSWTLFVSSTPEFRLNTAEVYFPAIALGTGLIISFLLTGIVFALTTSQIRATQMATKMTRQLEQQRAISMRSDRLRSLGEMAAGIAHELNQPLVGVRGLAEHILIAQDRGWNMDAQAIRQKVATIVEQADRMAHIIEHIRIFAREAGKPELCLVNVNDVIASSMNLLEAQFSSHGLSFEKDCAIDLPPVLVNPFSLEEAVLNLLLNARDAVEERLQVELEMHAPGIFVRTQLMKEQVRVWVQIEVIDNGVGIPEDLQGKIFDPFFTTKGPDKGTGLGLSISKTIVEEFGGTLTITSSLGERTTAVITLPVTT
jgi:signal transduction histidine kinase